MANTYKLTLENRQIMVNTLDMKAQEIYGLLQFANQHEFFSYFKEKGIIPYGILKITIGSYQRERVI